ncbi:MAG: phospholipid carrier-dependent glycosyltransferase [Verrucomicrobia bacterium]|nr:MAG: phospholipid carrier-dependent glycosyltransferase [Verrucomicrobiota bacterium]
MRHTPRVETQPQLPRGLVIAAVLISLTGLVFHDLWTPDEPREAALALAMNRSGDHLIPQLAGQPFVEKPPLYYASAAFWLRCSPCATPNAGWLRLTSLLWGLGTLMMTWLFARRLLDRQRATLTVLVLATLPGFVHVTHWLLTDVALMFFVTAALWALAEAYRAGRFMLLPLAGLFAAGAFLTKGIIGPVFIALGGLPLLLFSKPWKKEAVSDQRSAISGQRSVLFWHLAALISFILPVAAWGLAFWRTGGQALFMEWFWTNHFGRFSGAATQLGHISGPLYYLKVLPVYLLPWLPVVIWGLWRAVHDKIFRRKSVAPLMWGLGGVALLSLSATKREIYLAPLLPAFALLAAHTLTGTLPRRLAWCARPRYLATLVGLWLVGLTIAEPLVNRQKSYGPAFREFARQLTARADLRAAAWDLDETTRAGFYWYANRTFPALPNRTAVDAVLTGQHPRFNAVVICQKDGTLPVEFSVTQETAVRMGSHRTLLLLAPPLSAERSPRNFTVPTNSPDKSRT